MCASSLSPFEATMSRCSRMGSNYALAAFADAFLAGELSPHVKPDPRDE